jgi:hypothetical protein
MEEGDATNAPRADLDQLRVALRRALSEREQVEQLLEVAAVITAAMAEFGVEPVVVGGLAVAYWSGGRFITMDIDFLLPRLPNIEERVRELGFVQDGRHWVYPGSEISFEIPDQQLESGDQSERITTRSGGHVRVNVSITRVSSVAQSRKVYPMRSQRSREGRSASRPASRSRATKYMTLRGALTKRL